MKGEADGLDIVLPSIGLGILVGLIGKRWPPRAVCFAWYFLCYWGCRFATHI